MKALDGPASRGSTLSRLAVVTGLVLGAGVFLFLREPAGGIKPAARPGSSHGTPGFPPHSVAVGHGNQPPAGTPKAGTSGMNTRPQRSTSPASPDWKHFQSPGVPPEDDIRQLDELWRQFHQLVSPASHRPILENRDLVRIWSGVNKGRIRLIPENLVSPGGELLDRWGVPYHIHQMSSENIDFRSAGPDRVLFTADDLVSVRPPSAAEISARDFKPDPLPPPNDVNGETTDSPDTADFPTSPSDSPIHLN